jgi:hypothetical protein
VSSKSLVLLHRCVALRSAALGPVPARTPSLQLVPHASSSEAAMEPNVPTAPVESAEVTIDEKAGSAALSSAARAARAAPASARDAAPNASRPWALLHARRRSVPPPAQLSARGVSRRSRTSANNGANAM